MDKYASRVTNEFIRIMDFYAMIFSKYQIITELFCMSDDNSIKAKTEWNKEEEEMLNVVITYPTEWDDLESDEKDRLEIEA